MYNSNEVLTLRVDLDAEATKQFEAIKQTKGLKLNTEVIRCLIKDAYKEILSLSLDGTPGSLHEAQDPLLDSVETPVNPKGGS